MRQILKKSVWVILVLLTLLYIYPLILTFTNSLMSTQEITDHYGTEEDLFDAGPNYIEMHLVPDMVTLSQYRQTLIEGPLYLKMFWNSIKITVPIVLGQTVISALAAYGFTVLHFKGKEVLFFLYMIVMLLPLQVTLVPNFMMADWLHLTDSYLAIILPGMFNPFGVFLMRQYLKMMPDSYLEAAGMDGAGHIRILFYIVLPMARPAITCVALLTFVDYWNLVEQAVVFIRDSKAQPLSIFLAGINQQQMGVSFAAACFYVCPVLIILYYGQEYLKEGISLSGIKG